MSSGWNRTHTQAANTQTHTHREYIQLGMYRMCWSFYLENVRRLCSVLSSFFFPTNKFIASGPNTYKYDDEMCSIRKRISIRNLCRIYWRYLYRLNDERSLGSLHFIFFFSTFLWVFGFSLRPRFEFTHTHVTRVRVYLWIFAPNSFGSVAVDLRHSLFLLLSHESISMTWNSNNINLKVFPASSIVNVIESPFSIVPFIRLLYVRTVRRQSAVNHINAGIVI